MRTNQALVRSQRPGKPLGHQTSRGYRHCKRLASYSKRGNMDSRGNQETERND